MKKKKLTWKQRERRNAYERVRRYGKKLAAQVNAGTLSLAGMEKALKRKIDVVMNELGARR